MTPELRVAIERRYALHLGHAHVLTGGEQCHVWAVSTTQGCIVVRLSPAWRTVEELAWTHDVVRFVAPSVPEAVTPLVAEDGSTLFVHDAHSVAIFPFVTGQPLDREQPALRLAAARLLTRLHQRFIGWSLHHRRPPPGLSAPPSGSPCDDPDALRDGDLDAWRTHVIRPDAGLTLGLIHGDYYRSNLRCTEERITGVIDWDDSAIGFLMQEVAWSAWEFSKRSTGDDLWPERAHAYLAAYRGAGGPCHEAEYAHVVPIIRWRLREEVRYSLAALTRGEEVDREYIAGQIRAFQHLHDEVL